MLRLADLEGPLDDVEFPDGSVHKPVPFGPAEYKLWREAEKETDEAKRADAALTILRACYPTATDENFNCCTVRMLIAMVAHAARKINQVRDALKNVDAVAAAENPPQAPATTTPPSSPTTTGNTSSRSSRKRAAKTGGAPTTANPTDGQSSSGTPSTASTIAGESTPFAVNWTTSTAPSSPPTP